MQFRLLCRLGFEIENSISAQHGGSIPYDEAYAEFPVLDLVHFFGGHTMGADNHRTGRDIFDIGNDLDALFSQSLDNLR